ncbi:uncharacterized protein LOC143915581 isoform X2 [Arctopsyche grandis]|uniref:uncharacterized protein LOC143915581 isoform X2 n=1 Tax=Arctopsyche grandis TaxID=121162 RepID=UPI00406D7AB1
MPHGNGHTVIEMSPRHNRSRDNSPRPAGHDSPAVHAMPSNNRSPVRGLSPAGDRGHHGNNHLRHRNGDNHHGSNNHLNVRDAHHNTRRSNENVHNVSNIGHSPNEGTTPTSADPLLPHSRNRRDTHAKEEHTDHSQPLLETDSTNPKPPLAGPEIDDMDDDRDTLPASPDSHPGVDDGFFPSENDDDPKIEGRFGEGEEGHSKPGIDDDKKSVAGDDDDVDGYHISYAGGNGVGSRFNPNSPFPYAPEFQPGVEVRITPDVNVYQQKKNLAQGMMDLALLSANANQLRYVLEAGDLHPYFYPSLIFISASLILQIAVGVGLIINSRYNVKEHDDICKADRINDFTVIGIFLITIVNVFIASFGVATSPNVSPRTNPS